MKLALKKVVALITVLFLVPSIYGIDLQNKIPKNALYVFTINGQNIATKMSVSEMDKLAVVNNLCKQLANDSVDVKLGDLGVNIASPSYFFVELTDSIIYFTYLFPISDLKKFESAFVKEKEVTKDASGNKSIVRNDVTVAWNNEYGMIVGGEGISQYFTKHPNVYENYGYGKDEENENILVSPVDTTVAYPDEEGVVVDSVIAPMDTIAVDTAGVLYEQNYDYTNTWTSKYEQRKDIAMIWKQQKAKEIFSLSVAQSIVSNEKFTKSQDKTSDASMWVGSNRDVLYNFMSNFYRDAFNMSYKKAPELDENSPLFSDENYLISNVHCNGNNIKVDFNNTLDKRLASDYSKMTNAKLNKKFFKYISGENLLGYYSFAYNTQAIMEVTPHFMVPYLQMMPYTGDISSEIMDLYALFIDEVAIGKLVKGDGVFAMTNLSSKEVQYTTYEYDSLYNYTEVTKTKNETIPEFVIMYSTEDPSTTDKIFSIAYKKGALIKVSENHYETPKFPGMPFKISILQKDGIVFICNSKEQVDIILNGKVDKGIPKGNMKLMSSNSLNVFVDIKKTLSLIPSKKKDEATPSYYSTSDQMLDYSRKNVGEINIIQSKPSGNTIHSEMIFTIPQGNDNGVKYFLNFINEFYKISKTDY